jgi:hypothetical protein
VVIERMGSEAARLGLRVQGDYTFQSVSNTLLVVVEVVPEEYKVTSTFLNKGGRTRLAYVESETSGNLPNGFYLIQSSPELAKRMAARFGNKSGILENEKVNFVSTAGRITKEVSGTAMMYADPKYRHYWVRVELGSAFDPHGGGFWIDGGP